MIIFNRPQKCLIMIQTWLVLVFVFSLFWFGLFLVIWWFDFCITLQTIKTYIQKKISMKFLIRKYIQCGHSFGDFWYYMIVFMEKKSVDSILYILILHCIHDISLLNISYGFFTTWALSWWKYYSDKLIHSSS